MKIRMTAILVVMLLTVAGRAQAGIIFSMSPAFVNAETSDFVQMDLIVSGLGDDATPSLGTFDLDIGYDTAHLAVDSWLVGNALGDFNLFEAADFSLGDNMMGTLSLSELLDRSDNDRILAKMKVLSVLEALPKLGKVKARRTMDEVGISDSRRLRGLGSQQRAELVARFG